MPALLNNMSNLPPVRLMISAFKAVILSDIVTSRVRVSIPFSSSPLKDLRDLAVAKTRIPWDANCRARAWPALPLVHLVTRSVKNLDSVRSVRAYPVIRIDR
jgi:hypothetical protein